MEHLFSPCTRFLYILENEDHLEEDWDDFKLLRERNLDVSTNEFLSAERALHTRIFM
jgi:hypothetical protein